MKRLNLIVGLVLALGLQAQASELDGPENAPQGIVVKADAKTGNAITVFKLNSTNTNAETLDTLSTKDELKDVQDVNTDKNSSELDKDSSTQAWGWHHRGDYWHRDYCGDSYFSYRRYELRSYYHWYYSRHYRGYDWYYYDYSPYRRY